MGKSPGPKLKKVLPVAVCPCFGGLLTFVARYFVKVANPTPPSATAVVVMSKVNPKHPWIQNSKKIGAMGCFVPQKLKNGQ